MFYQNYSVEDHPNYSIENVIFSYFMVILLPKKSAYHQQLRILSGEKKKQQPLRYWKTEMFLATAKHSSIRRCCHSKIIGFGILVLFL